MPGFLVMGSLLSVPLASLPAGYRELYLKSKHRNAQTRSQVLVNLGVGGGVKVSFEPGRNGMRNATWKS